MSEPLEARVIVHQKKDGKHEISSYDPQTGRHIQTGLAVPPDQVEKTVRQLKETFERAGNRSTVKEM